MDEKSLKKLLLSKSFFCDNEYLDCYVELITRNKDQVYVAHETQKHHIIPVCYYTDNELVIDNSENNVVNLFYKDHLLAHYYLALCTIGEYKYKMLYAINHITGNIKWMHKDNNFENIANFLNSLDKYQELYEEFKQHQTEKLSGRKRSAEAEAKRLATRKAKGVGKHSEETKQRMRHSHRMSGKPRKLISEEARQKMKKSAKGRNNHIGNVWVNNGERMTLIPKDKLIVYLNEGYVRGRLKLTYSPQALANLKAAGKAAGSKPKSAETKLKISNKLKERHKNGS